MWSSLRRLLARPTTCLGLLALFTGLLVSTGSLNSLDTFRRLQVTHWIWTDAPQVRDEDQWDRSFVVLAPNQQKFVTWGIGQSVAMLPGDVVAQLLMKVIHFDVNPERIRSAVVTYTTFPIINAISVVLAFQILHMLGFGRSPSIYGAVGLLFATSFLPYAQTHAENSLQFMLLMSGYACSLGWVKTGSRRLLILAACSVGLSFLIRITNIIDAMAVYAFTIAVIFQQARSEEWRSRSPINTSVAYTLQFALAFAPFIVLDRVYNYIRFDSIFGTYTSLWGEQLRALIPTLPTTFPFSTPFFDGFLGFLFAPDRSIFIFNPLLILIAVLMIGYWHQISSVVRMFALSLGFLLLADMCLYAKWFLWGGAVSWGPRYALVPSQGLSLLAIALFISLLPLIRWQLERWVYGVIIASSVVVQVVSVLFDCYLELAQEDSCNTGLFSIWQRIVNVTALSTGNFASWGLVPAAMTPAELEKFTTVSFMPWRVAHELPDQIAHALKFGWWVGLGAIVILISLVIIPKLRVHSHGHVAVVPPPTRHDA